MVALFTDIKTAVVFATGVAVIFYAVLSILQFIYGRFLRPGKHLKKYGKWSVVTGATDGIGKAMAFELAKKGLNVVLISRTLDKLNACKEELTAKFPSSEFQVLDVDFGNFCEAERSRVSSFLAEMDIGVLVNNVGQSYPFTKYFHELDDERVQQLVKLNVDSATWMTRIVIPGMVERKRGAIVNIGSVAGIFNSPLLAQYGAAKAYVAMFSRTMCVEYAKFNIHVQCQVPFYVATKLAKIRRTSLFVPSPEAYAKSAVAAIGYESVVSPYWSHALQVAVLQLLPEFLVTGMVFSMNLNIRKAGMKKEAEKKSD